jgi:hypothetical protein
MFAFTNVGKKKTNLSSSEAKISKKIGSNIASELPDAGYRLYTSSLDDIVSRRRWEIMTPCLVGRRGVASSF